MRVAMVTCQELPEPDTDEALYAPALREFGIDAELAAAGIHPGHHSLYEPADPVDDEAVGR